MIGMVIKMENGIIMRNVKECPFCHGAVHRYEHMLQCENCKAIGDLITWIMTETRMRDLRGLAELLIKEPYLEVLLMLTDEGPKTVEQISKEIIYDANVTDLLDKLKEFDTIDIKDNLVNVTNYGQCLVIKMRKKVEMGKVEMKDIKKVNFDDIVNNPDYYEMTDDGKDFFVCATEGYIPKNKIDTEQTKYLDMHCKCGDPVVRKSFTSEELDL